MQCLVRCCVDPGEVVNVINLAAILEKVSIGLQVLNPVEFTPDLFLRCFVETLEGPEVPGVTVGDDLCHSESP